MTMAVEFDIQSERDRLERGMKYKQVHERIDHKIFAQIVALGLVLHLISAYLAFDIMFKSLDVM